MLIGNYVCVICLCDKSDQLTASTRRTGSGRRRVSEGVVGRSRPVPRWSICHCVLRVLHAHCQQDDKNIWLISDKGSDADFMTKSILK